MNKTMPAQCIEKIVSGGQTGVDRAALDVALEMGIACGGWCPKGRVAEDGMIDERYPLQETPLQEYGQRTEWNVRDSDGTLILYFEKRRKEILRYCSRGKINYQSWGRDNADNLDHNSSPSLKDRPP